MSRGGMWFAALLASAATLALAGAVPLEAQYHRQIEPEHKVKATLQLHALLFDNYFQAPRTQPDSTLRAGSLQLRLAGEAIPQLGGELRVDGRVMVFQRLQPTYGIGTGLRLEQWSQRLEVALDYDRSLPRPEVTDTMGQADVARASAVYAVRMGRALELSALGNVRAERFVSENPNMAAEWRDHTFREGGVTARTRAFGYRFSPEIGVARGGPRGWDAERTYVQSQWHVQVRSLPAPWLYLSARYRNRRREYPDAPPDARNFERTDRRGQVTLMADVTVAEGVSWTLYFTDENGRSNQAFRDFRTRLLSIGLSLRTP